MYQIILRNAVFKVIILILLLASVLLALITGGNAWNSKFNRYTISSLVVGLITVALGTFVCWGYIKKHIDIGYWIIAGACAISSGIAAVMMGMIQLMLNS